MGTRGWSLLLTLIMVSSAPVRAQDSVETNTQWSVIPLASFNPTRSSTTFDVASDPSGAYHARTSPSGFFHAPLGVPSGSQVHEICVFAYDNTASNELSLLVVYTEMGDAIRPAVGGLVPSTLASTGVAAVPGYVRLCRRPSPALYVGNYGDPSGDGVSGWVSWAIQVARATSLGHRSVGAARPCAGVRPPSSSPITRSLRSSARRLTAAPPRRYTE